MKKHPTNPHLELDPWGLFRWVDSNDPKAGHRIRRTSDTTLRIAHVTDIHLPCEVDLAERIRHLAKPEASLSRVVRKLEGLGNALGHDYHAQRERLTNLVKKVLFALHALDVDHLILTGDIAHCGLAPEFLEMRAILELTDWPHPSRSTIVPGNHDRFNLYEPADEDSIETYFDVVHAARPRLTPLGDEVVLLEIDSNRPPTSDPHFAQAWLPNTVGRIDEAVFSYILDHHREYVGRRLLVLLHHHVSDDWYSAHVESVGGLMDPVEDVGALLDHIQLIDPDALILHGHKHEVMPADYRFRQHPVSCPGALFQDFRCNLIDIRKELPVRITQVQCRHRDGEDSP